MAQLAAPHRLAESGFAQAYRSWRRETTPYAMLCVWTITKNPRSYSVWGDLPGLLRVAAEAHNTPWEQRWQHANRLIETFTHREHVHALAIIEGPAATRAHVLDVLRAHENRHMFGCATWYGLRVSEYVPPVDVRFCWPNDLGGRMRDAFEVACTEVSCQLDDVDVVQNCAARVLRRAANEPNGLRPYNASAVLRWPYQLRVLVDWSMMLLDWHACLPAYVALWVLEWTDAPFNWRGTEVQRIDTIQRVCESRRRVLAARDGRTRRERIY